MNKTILGFVVVIAIAAAADRIAPLVPIAHAAELNVSQPLNHMLAAAAKSGSANNPSQGVTMYWFCEVDSMGAPPLQSYFSNIFEAPDQNAKVMRDTFATYIFGKYSQKGNPQCEAMPDGAAAEKELKRNENLMSNPQNKRKVVEVSWDFSAGGSGSTAANTPQSGSSSASTGSSGRVFFHFCVAGGATRMEGAGMQTRSIPMPLYISDIYPVPMDKSINGADGIAFAQFLGGKYDPYFSKSKARCGGNFTDMTAAEVAKQQQEASYRNNARLSPSSYPNPNVEETGWKWAGSQ